MQRIIGCSLFLILFFSSLQLYSQPAKKPKLHELAPYVGVYAPDRFETSLAFGVRYYYRISRFYAAGGVLGFAHARQSYLRKTSNFVPVAGSDRVLYNGVRLYRTLLLRTPVQPYLIAQLGLTRLLDENNLTVALGLGTRIMYSKNMNLRYEIVTHFFRTGVGNTAWTNKNIEIAFALGFYL